MTGYEHFYVDKVGEPFAVQLAAGGLERIVTELLYHQTDDSGNAILADRGPYYQITCTPPLERETAERYCGLLMPITPIMTVKNADQFPDDLLQRAVSYEAERERTDNYYAARKNNQDAAPPDRHWDVYRAINPATLKGYNNLVTDWWKVRECPEVLFLLLDLFSRTPNDLESAIEAWKALDRAEGWGIGAEATGQQLYNPDQGKGQNKSKADGLSIGNLKNFWLIEWLKAVGFYEVAMTRTVRGAKDRKTFVVAPREITFRENRDIMDRFVDTMRFSETSTKFDVLAAVRYLQALLAYFYESDRPRLFKRGRIKKELVSGFHTAFYKDMGNVVATMNISFIALPGWVEVHSEKDVRIHTELLDELELLTRQFDESHSDAFTLLQYLRDFVSGDDLDAFFRFTNAFPAYLMGMRERGKYAYPLSTVFIERLMMSTDPKLSEIVQNEGFQNIAYAIRQSTVTAQYRKSQGDRKYDVRYGLGQDLARKARYPEDFIVALSDFLHKYNAENAQIMETRSGPYRKSIRTSDVDEIVRLIDEYGSQPVANLLIAYGYARVPRDEDSIEELETGQEDQS